MADKLGTFYGVGVGPGDPELLTLKAVRVLEDCPVLAAPQMASGEMTALNIARQAARLEGKTLLPLRFTMSRDRGEQAAGPASPHHPRRRPGAGRGAGPAGEQGADEGGQEPPEAAGGAGGPEAAGPGGYGGELRPAGGAAFCGSHGET